MMTITEKEDVKTVTSLEVAEMVGKEHNELLKDIRRYAEQFSQGKIPQSDFWKESTYQTSRGKEYPCYLVTKKGCEFIAHKLTGTKGTEFTAKYIEKFHDMEDTIQKERSGLSPNLQMLYAMIDEQARIELEQKKQAQQIEQVKSTVNTMQEIFVRPIGDWQAEINKMVREISIKSQIPYQELWAKLYGELETTAKCSLKRLCENKKKRMETAGNTKTAIKSKTTKLSVIQDNQRLKSIFENIVKRYAMAYLPEKSVIA